MKFTVVEMKSDLSGEVFPEGEGELVRFSYRGRTYEIDLTAEEVADLDHQMAPYVEHAKQTGGPRG